VKYRREWHRGALVAADEHGGIESLRDTAAHAIPKDTDWSESSSATSEQSPSVATNRIARRERAGNERGR
jgi:hypothetical protein